MKTARPKWPEVAIEDFAEVVTGGTPSTQKSEYWKGGNIPWLNSGELNKGVITHADNFITEEGLKNSAAQMMPENTVLVALTGATTGVSALLKIRACGNQSVTGILPSKHHNAHFLFRFMQSIRPKIVAQSYGGAQKHISQGYVKKLKVPLPPIEEQERIANLLDEVDELRKLRAQADRRTADLIPALFHEMFGDPDVNPKKLPIVSLGNLLSFRTGKLDSNAAVEGGAYPFFTCSREDSRIDTYAFDCEALLLAGNNAVGEYSVKHYKGKFNAYQRTYILNLLAPDHSYGFMQQALQLRLQEMKRLSLGTNTKYLTLGILKNIKIPLPDSALQKEFATKVAEIRELEAEQAATRRRLDDLFQSLLHRAFQGEL